MSVTIETIRQKILDQAMRGELVEQDPNDEPVETLLEQIEREKEGLIKEKKIKKQRKIPEIEKDEIPFELTKGWKWKRLKDISYNFGQKKPKDDFLYIDVSVIDGKKGEISKEVQKIAPSYAPSRARKIIKNGTVIYSTVRPYLRNIAIIEGNFEDDLIASTAFAILHPFNGINSKYVYYYLRTKYVQDHVESKMTGVAYPAINDKEFFSILIPIPPTNEQNRIVEKIESLFRLCDKWEDEVIKQQNHLSALREKVLDNAIRGQLVEQDESDEPAEVLLKKIEEEKEQLIKEKMIKKSKPLPEIEKDEIPYEIPKGWKWVKLGEISKRIHYGYTASATEEDTGVKMVRITDIQNERVNWENVPYCKIEKEDIEKYSLLDNDILVARTGGTVGKSFIVDIVHSTSVFASYLIRIQIFEQVDPRYIKKFLESEQYWKQLLDKTEGTGQPNVNATGLSNLVIPIPPLNEQERIVEKIENVFDYIDQLEKQVVLPK